MSLTNMPQEPLDLLFLQCLNHMDAWFHKLESCVPKPSKIPYLNGSFVFRYKEKSLEQALIQKLARVVTGLHSARILLNSGFLQEQIAIHRMLDEFQQDISFLCSARLDNDFTSLHQEYLDVFYKEEFDKPQDPVASKQKRSTIPRRKIYAYNARKEAELGISNPSRSVDLSQTLGKAYSGFVHGASPQILNMYGGSPPRFYVSGMTGHPHEHDHRRDIWNYFFRGLLSFNEAALVLEQSVIVKEIADFTKTFQNAEDIE